MSTAGKLNMKCVYLFATSLIYRRKSYNKHLQWSDMHY